MTGQRLRVVVEVDQQGLAETGLDEAVGVTVEVVDERLAGQEVADVGNQVSPSKCVTDPAFEAGTLAASPMTKMFGADLDCSVCSSVGTKFSASPSPGERPTYSAPPCRGTTTARSKGTSRPSYAIRRPADAVDLAGVELGDQFDVLLGEHAAEVLLRQRAW